VDRIVSGVGPVPPPLTVTVLGCSGSYPVPGCACSGYLVRHGHTCLWLDAGSGTLAHLQQHARLADVDAIVLSHEHPDHWTDIEGFAVASVYYLHLPPVRVLAPAGLQERVHGAPDAFRWEVVGDGDRATVGSLDLRFSRTDHPPETLAVRVDGGGRSFGYSADTGPGWSLEELGPGLDLAICEATYLRHEEGEARHMSARQAGSSARSAGAPRLLVTHLAPTTDRGVSRAEAAGAFGGPVDVASDHLVVTV
jgi:ribonuclease BN (tRNA processing enzyme)